MDTDASSAKRRCLQHSVTIDAVNDVDDGISSKFVRGLRLHCTSGRRAQYSSLVAHRPPSGGKVTSSSSSSSSDIGGSDRDERLLLAEVVAGEAIVSSSSGPSCCRKSDAEWLPVSSPDPAGAMMAMASPSWQARRRARLTSDESADHLGFIGYERDTYEHRRSLETRYHPVHCLTGQPQVYRSGSRRVL